MKADTPYQLYLARLAISSRQSVDAQLKHVATLLQWEEAEREQRYASINFLDATHIRTLLIELGWAPRTINRVLVAMRNIVKLAVMTGEAKQEHYLQLQTVPGVKHGDYDGRPLSEQNIQQLFTYLQKDSSAIGLRNHAIFAVFLGTGIRRSELAALKLADIDVTKCTLFVAKGKGNRSRTAFTPGWVIDAIYQWLSARTSDDGYLFCKVLRGGHCKPAEGLTHSQIHNIVARTLKHAGLSKASAHDLRRTFITRLLEQGVDLNTVRQMAGHANIATTVIYDKRDDKAMQDAALALSYSKGGA